MTLLNEKFVYTPIDRKSVEGKRLYALPDGSKVPSVTTILDKTKSQEKIDALNNWKKRVGEAKAQEIVTEAAGRGTRMHKFLEDFCLTDKLNDPGTNPYSVQSHKMAKTIITNGMCNVNEVWGVEVPLYYPGLYAGTTDCCGIHLTAETIIDYKQTNKPKKKEWIDDYFIQLCAYALAHNKLHGTKMRKGVIMMCVKPPEIGKTMTWGEPEYQEFILEGAEFDKYTRQWWDRVELYFKNN